MYMTPKLIKPETLILARNSLLIIILFLPFFTTSFGQKTYKTTVNKANRVNINKGNKVDIKKANNVQIKIEKQIIQGNWVRIISPNGLDTFFKEFPDKNITIQFCSIGSPNKEIFSVANQIADLLIKKGYKNLNLSLNTAFGVEIPSQVRYTYNSEMKVVVFEIPPID